MLVKAKDILQNRERQGYRVLKSRERQGYRGGDVKATGEETCC